MGEVALAMDAWLHDCMHPGVPDTDADSGARRCTAPDDNDHWRYAGRWIHTAGHRKRQDLASHCNRLG